MIDKALRESRKKQADCPAFGLSVLIAGCHIGRQTCHQWPKTLKKKATEDQQDNAEQLTEILTTIRAGETGNSAHGYPRRCSAPANAMDTVAIGGRQTSVPALEAVQTAEYVLASPERHSRTLVRRN